MSLYYVYRINGGQVQTVSVESHMVGLSTYFAEVKDPPIPDGPGLESPKIWDGVSVRNATPSEISNFTAAQAVDELAENRDRYSSFFDENNVRGMALKAISEVMINEINILRQWVVQFKAEVAAATNLANLQSRVASLPNLPDRTLAQGRTAIKNAISSGNND